jgi:transcriptional regulator of acetoin/glycerol metabolism
LLCALLALAFARPFWANAAPIHTPLSMPTYAVIVLDLSYSMQYGDWFNKAKKRVNEILDDLNEGDQVALLGASNQVQVILNWTADRAAVKRAVQRLEPTFEIADLPARIQAGTFRVDLYYRLARLEVTVPPLCRRTEDIPLLARHFVQVFAAEMGREPPVLEGVMVARLQAYSFPGNVRELKNIVERALIESRGALLEPSHLHLPDEPQETQTAAGDEPLVSLEAWERAYILRVLERVSWVITGPQGAAGILGLPPSTLRNRMIKLGIERA